MLVSKSGRLIKYNLYNLNRIWNRSSDYLVQLISFSTCFDEEEKIFKSQCCVTLDMCCSTLDTIQSRVPAAFVGADLRDETVGSPSPAAQQSGEALVSGHATTGLKAHQSSW